MALAREQDDIPGPGPLERRRDRGRPVGDQRQVPVAAPAGRLGPGRDLVQDRLAILVARVLVGDDHQPAALARDPAHHRPLRDVALARRAEHRDQAAAACRGDRGKAVQDRLERVGAD